MQDVQILYIVAAVVIAAIAVWVGIVLIRAPKLENAEEQAKSASGSKAEPSS